MGMKNILIVGATGGIGKALCESCLEEYQLYIHGRSQQKLNQLLLEELKKKEKEAIPVIFDVNSKDEMKEALESIDSLDVVIYNVGMLKDQLLCDIDLHDWNQIMYTNYQAAVDLYELVKDKLTLDSAIVVMCSISGVKGRPGQGAYSVSKAMLIEWVKFMSEQDKGKYFFAVSPGPVKTSLIEGTPWFQDANAVNRIPLRRYAEPSEVAQFIYTLVRNREQFKSGKNYILDGGFTETMRINI